MSISCIDCPSFLRKQEAEAFYQIASAPGPMCARYGWLFGTSDDAVTEASIAKYAENCSFHGEVRPLAEAPMKNLAAAFTPDTSLLVPSGTKASSCGFCVNFDTKSHACAALGRMIFPERLVAEAATCIWGKGDIDNFGNIMSHKEVGAILPQMTGSTVSVSLTPKPTATTPRKKRVGVLKWPNAYESDAPLTEENKAEGIRAWRKVDTRQGAIFLPIFRSDHFGDRASLIPDPDAEGTADPSLYLDHSGLLEKFAVVTYKLDLNLLLTGEPGTGKTEGVTWLAWMLNMPFERLPYTESSEPDQFLGSPQYGDTGKVNPITGEPILGTFLQPGLLPTAWGQAGVLLSDEINMPREAIQQAYRSANDSSRVLVVYGQKFVRHDYCFHLAAMNPAHDFRNIGASPLASADSSRYTFHHMPNPSEDVIRKVLTASIERLDGVAPDPFMVTTLIKIGKDLRQASRDGSLPDFWTLRQEVKVARMVPFFGLMGAYNAAYLDYVDDNTRKLCEEFILSHKPSGPSWAD